jgi:hypothetical protein
MSVKTALLGGVSQDPWVAQGLILQRPGRAYVGDGDIAHLRVC